MFHPFFYFTHNKHHSFRYVLLCSGKDRKNPMQYGLYCMGRKIRGSTLLALWVPTGHKASHSDGNGVTGLFAALRVVFGWFLPGRFQRPGKACLPFDGPLCLFPDGNPALCSLLFLSSLFLYLAFFTIIHFGRPVKRVFYFSAKLADYPAACIGT